MADQASTLLELAKVRADNREVLNAIAGVQGTALGLKNYDPATDLPSGDPCIIVYVPHKIHEKFLSEAMTIPERLTSRDGLLEALTDVVVTTVPDTAEEAPELSEENKALIGTLQWMDGKMDYIGPGVQIGAAEVGSESLETYVGTVGYIVRSKTDPELIGFLTNQHVGLHAGHSLYIPGFRQNALRIGVTRVVLEHKPDDEWITGIDEKFAYVRTDSAFVVVEENIVPHLKNEILNVGPIGEVYAPDLNSMEIIGKPVKKIGRTTGLQYGVITAFGYGIPGSDEMIDRYINKEPANFYTDFLIAPRTPSRIFSTHGDSGSPILLDTNDADADRPLALLWGGWPADIGRNKGVEDLTYGINLNRILNELNLEFL